jgi:hypothetical protein
MHFLFAQKRNIVSRHFSDISWLQQLPYLDIFSKLNVFNLSMQCRSMTVLIAEDKVASMKFKFKSW